MDSGPGLCGDSSRTHTVFISFHNAGSIAIGEATERKGTEKKFKMLHKLYESPGQNQQQNQQENQQEQQHQQEQQQEQQSEYHNYQWGQTNNAVTIFCSYYSYTRDGETEFDQNTLRSVLLGTPALGTEKLDGTNVGKDDAGIIYGRRLIIDKDKASYQKASLDKVKVADINKVKKALCKALELPETQIRKIVVYGELICNNDYDYADRNMLAAWKVFGAMLVPSIPGNAKHIHRKLVDNNFAAVMDSEARLRILPCQQLLSLATACGLEVVGVRGEGRPVCELVAGNKEAMVRGQLEGLVLTLHNTTSGQHYILKWKGAQEHQPAATTALTKVINLLDQDPELGDNIKTFYRNLHEVAQADSSVNVKVRENEEAKKRKKMERKQKSGETESGEGRRPGPVDRADSKLIIEGVHHSMKKFDDLAVYKENGSDGVEKYIRTLQEETRKHFVEEKEIADNFSEDDPIITFINSIVRKIVARRM